MLNEERLGRLVNLRDIMVARDQSPNMPELPINTMRNNTTGETYQFESAPVGDSGYSIDYSRPIEIFGQGKGYAINGQPLAAMINGRRVDYGVDATATRAAQDRAAQIADKRRKVASDELAALDKQISLGEKVGSLFSGGGAAGSTQQAAAPGAGQSMVGQQPAGGERLSALSGVLSPLSGAVAQMAAQRSAAPKPLTESQGKAAKFAIRAEDADAILDSVGRDGSVQPGIIKRSAEAVPWIGEPLGTLTNWTQSEPQQQVEQAQRNFINAVLRDESGANVLKPEFDNARKQYFPQPGDSSRVISQKRINRQAQIAGMKAEAAHGYEQAKAEFERLKAARETAKAPEGAASVTLPDGRIMTFPSKAHADGFRRAAGL